MKQFNVNLFEEDEANIALIIELGRMRSRSHAVRRALQIAAKFFLSKRGADYHKCIGIMQSIADNPSPAFSNHADLWSGGTK